MWLCSSVYSGRTMTDFSVTAVACSPNLISAKAWRNRSKKRHAGLAPPASARVALLCAGLGFSVSARRMMSPSNRCDSCIRSFVSRGEMLLQHVKNTHAEHNQVKLSLALSVSRRFTDAKTMIFLCLFVDLGNATPLTGISVWTILSVAEACVYAAHSMQIYSMHKYPDDLLHLPKCALVHEIFHPTMHSLLICNLTFHSYSYEQTKSNIRFLTSVSWLLDIQTHCQDFFGENWTTKTENVSKTRKWHLVTSSSVNVNVRCLETQRSAVDDLFRLLKYILRPLVC